MLVVILGMLICIAIAVLVVGLVALPAHREGETIFVPRDGAVMEPTEPIDVSAHREPAHV